MLKFPKLVGVDQLKKAQKRATLSVLPMSMLVFVERATSNRGLLHEIEAIIAAKQLSPPLTYLFQGKPSIRAAKRLKYDHLPGLLSSAQKQVMKIAANAALGCVSGPPGTGKSYTIAAIAAEHTARGESVLIVANNESALDVISDKLDANFGLADLSVRAGQKEFLKKLKAYIADLLVGYSSDIPEGELKRSGAQLQKLNRRLVGLERGFTRGCQKAIVRGQRLRYLEQSGAPWMLRLYLAIIRRKISHFDEQWDALDQINQQQLQREQLAGRFLSLLKDLNLKKLIETQRKSLQAFNQAIRSRSSQRQFEQFAGIDYTVLLSAFPVWLVSLNTLHRVLPLKREMFDLVIIDEATQCNITSCLPAFYRAKRVLVVGDTKQLRHYSFLAQHKESELMAKYQLVANTDGAVSYAKHSILDLGLATITSHQQLAFLDEHYRSKPELIGFSNRCFYQNRLKVMQHRPCASSGHLFIQRTEGTRNVDGVNEIEAAAVILWIQAKVADDQVTGIYHSIGVISPFTHQAQHLSKSIYSHFSVAQIKAHKLMAATPFGFQGEERDIMLLSFALDNDAKRAAVYLNKPDVFNVTITRARSQQVLFLSLDEMQLPEHNLLRRYVASINTFVAEHSLNTSLDAFQSSVITLLEVNKIDVWPGYTLAGTEIDILCRFQGRYLALDLIGYPGHWASYFELNTYQLFKRAGIEVLPLSYGLWVVDAERCVEKIMALLAG